MRAFTRQFGPLAYLQPGTSLFDARLWVLGRDLLELARLWSEADADGQSQFLGTASTKADYAVPNIIHWLHDEFSDHGQRLPPGSLAYNIVLEALRFIHQRLEMRRCPHCSLWFTPVRSDQRYCQAVCRVGAFRRPPKAG
jgi:hypothetical protein